MKRLQSGLLCALFALQTAAHAQITLEVSVFPELDRSVKAALPLWASLHPDITINLLALYHADHHTAMTTALATGSNLPDVMALDVDFIGRFADSGGLEDLSLAPYNAMQYREQFTGYSFTQAIRPPHGLAGLPLDLGPGTLFYRKDLMDRAHVNEGELTKSWDSYIQAGRKLKAATGVYLIANALEIESNVIRSGLKESDGIYFDRNGATLVTTARFQKAFELAKAARLAGIDANVPEWSSEWSEAFKRNQIGSQMMGSWLAGHLQTWLAPESAGLWRAALLPGGLYSSYGGSFYAIPKKAKHRREAWEFIKFMTLNKAVQISSFRSIDAFPSLISAQDDPFSDQPIAYLGGQKARLLWRDIARRAPAITVNRFDKVAEEVVNVELDNVLLLDKDINTALADAKDIIERRVNR
jgi:multiple sugar transport system substrate-binding protein